MKVEEELLMALPQKLVEHIIIGLYDPINQHLVKLVAFDFALELRQHFRREIRTWFRKLQRLRIKPSNRTGTAKFYFNLLFEYPFGGVEIRNMQLIMDEISEEYEETRPTRSAGEMVDWLRKFHEELAERLHNGEDVLDMIPD